MNRKQRKARRKYSVLYGELDTWAEFELQQMPIGVFVEMIPEDHTVTKCRFCQLYELLKRVATKPNYEEPMENCLMVYRMIVNYGILLFDEECSISVTDWVNLRDVLTLMMTKYWIGVPKDWGKRPAAVQKRLDEAIARYTEVVK